MSDTQTNPVGADLDQMRSSDLTSRRLRQQMVKTMGFAPPISLFQAISDWAMHLAASPDTQMSLASEAQDKWLRWWSNSVHCNYAGHLDDHESKDFKDRRFSHVAWQIAPFAALAQGFLIAEEFIDRATVDVPGMSPDHKRMLTFFARQAADAFAPSNFLLTNPEALLCTQAESGQNLVRGYHAWLADVQSQLRQQNQRPLSQVGTELGLSAGEVVFRNHLMELIQYKPTSDKVHPEPMLIVPAWIMKYYILDLTPENSLVKYLTDQGFTVFMISWRNPSADDADLGLEDYLKQGPLAAIDHISKKTGAQKIHTAGYCLGGTLLSIASAHLARIGDGRLASMTLLAAQTDFSEAGELMTFISESQVSFLEDIMAEQGYLDADQMMSSFQMMRSNDLVWSRLVRKYLFGVEEAPLHDLLAWNADTTRMPAKMHSEYLRKMFLNNDLASGRYEVDGHPVFLRDIRAPIFAIGTETDHIAPWKSVFKIHGLTNADVSFVLTNGGHNAGVLSEPGHKHRHFKLHTTRTTDQTLSVEDWLSCAASESGSWWPAWVNWLAQKSTPKTVPPAMTGNLYPAPGTYVMME